MPPITEFVFTDVGLSFCYRQLATGVAFICVMHIKYLFISELLLHLYFFFCAFSSLEDDVPVPLCKYCTLVNVENC